MSTKGAHFSPNIIQLTEDYMASVAVQNTTYAFDVDGEDVYITFPSKTLFPYVANDEIYISPL